MEVAHIHSSAKCVDRVDLDAEVFLLPQCTVRSGYLHIYSETLPGLGLYISAPTRWTICPVRLSLGRLSPSAFLAGPRSTSREWLIFKASRLWLPAFIAGSGRSYRAFPLSRCRATVSACPDSWLRQTV